jgi:serine/threonine-protein kinase RIO1
MRSFVAAALLGAASATIIPQIEHAFMKFVAEHGKSYGTVEEYKFRMQQFERTDKYIQEHRSTKQTHTAGHNQMSDWTEAEYKRLMGYKQRVGVRPMNIRKFTPSNADGVNWVTKGAVTPVQN